jgi:curved DNA-binding protein CbpA
MQDHYKTLGLSSAATREEIRRAYRVLARRYHPDVNPGNSTAERFREISRAYETLSDPERRKQYDSERETEESFSSAFDRSKGGTRYPTTAISDQTTCPSANLHPTTTGGTEASVEAAHETGAKDSTHHHKGKTVAGLNAQKDP